MAKPKNVALPFATRAAIRIRVTNKRRVRGKGKKTALSSVERQRRYRIARNLGSIQLSGATLQVLKEARQLAGTAIDDTVVTALNLLLASLRTSIPEKPEEPLRSPPADPVELPDTIGKKRFLTPVPAGSEILGDPSVPPDPDSSLAHELAGRDAIAPGLPAEPSGRKKRTAKKGSKAAPDMRQKEFDV